MSGGYTSRQIAVLPQTLGKHNPQRWMSLQYKNAGCRGQRSVLGCAKIGLQAGLVQI